MFWLTNGVAFLNVNSHLLEFPFLVTRRVSNRPPAPIGKYGGSAAVGWIPLTKRCLYRWIIQVRGEGGTSVDTNHGDTKMVSNAATR